MSQLFEQFMQNFEIILVALVLICLCAYLWDSIWGYRKQRKILWQAFSRGEETQAQREIYALRLAAVITQSKKPETLPEHFHRAQNQLTHKERLGKKEMHWLRIPVFPNEKLIDGFSGSFWILFIIFMVRSFIIEPYRIPSGSMEPTLYAGDFIVADKFSYSIRLPISNTKMIPTGKVERGDVIVFNFPLNPNIKYIKRVVGIPGDRIMIENNRVILNGKEIEMHVTKKSEGLLQAEEILGDKKHALQFDLRTPILGTLQLTVPEGKYFVMGDNRDHSEDSRFWGYVDDQHLIGKARFIWLNSNCIFFKGHCERIGNSL